MTASFGVSNGDPGWTGIQETTERNIYWGTDPTKNVQYIPAITLASATVDSTNTPTTLLRAGLALGKITATGFYTAYSPTATDGSQQAVAILREEVNMLDPMTAAVNTRVVSAVITGPVKASAIANLDNIARKQLRASGIIFDDDRTNGYGIPFIRVVSKAADYTVLATDQGTLFTAITGAVNFTLPTLAAGLHFMFYNLVDANMTITSAAADTIITDGDLAADSVAFSTSSHKIGGGVMLIANEDATKWISIFMGAAPANVVTVAT